MDATRNPKGSRKRRARRPKTPDDLSVEKMLRQSFSESLKEYTSNCSLAGARQMCDDKLGWLERTIWALLFCTAIVTVGFFLKYTWSDTLSKPFVVTMESTTYPISSIDFPAIAICNINRISKKALHEFAVEEYRDLAAENQSLEEVENMLLNWGRLINFSYNASMLSNAMYLRMIEKYRLDDKKVTKIMRMLAPSCKEMLLRCAWEGAVVDCDTIFSTHRVANRGHCCTFNYLARMVKTQTTPVKRQKEAGPLHGLSVLLDAQIHDYAYPLSGMQGFDVLILDPWHFADPSAGRVVHRICEPNMEVFLELRSTKQIATQEVRKYAVSTRKCLFQNEDTTPTFLFDVYSYSTCIVYCRIEAFYSLCKCTPFFWATEKMQKGPVCTLENLRCLNKYKERLYYLFPIMTHDTTGLEMEVQDSVHCPDCLPDCELTHYSTKSFEIPVTSSYTQKESKSLFLQDVNLTDRSFLSIYHPLPDATLDRLDTVYYWFEILSNIGGFCGIIIGFSIVSAVEIVYFFTIRFVANLCKKIT